MNILENIVTSQALQLHFVCTNTLSSWVLSESLRSEGRKLGENVLIYFRDKFVVHGAHARHVAVICENQFFELEAVKADGSFASEKELAIQLTAIQK